MLGLIMKLLGEINMTMIGEELETFDEIVNAIYKSYTIICEANGYNIDINRNEITDSIQENFEDEILKYGWNGEEKLSVFVSEKIFHETFSKLSQDRYMKYLDTMQGHFDLGYLEIEDINTELKQLKRLYLEDNCDFDNSDQIFELKQSLHNCLLEMYNDLDEILFKKQVILNMNSSNKTEEHELLTDLKQKMKKMQKLRFHHDQMVDWLGSLDTSSD